MIKWIKLILVFISGYLIFTSTVPYYWVVVCLYWTLNFLQDVIKK